MLPVRTNNDIEGWQHSLNRRSGNKVHLPFYLLVELLDQESHLVSIQIRLVSDGKLSRIQRKKYWQLQERVFKHWEDFNFKEISARRLLKLCSYLNGPVGRSEDAPIYLPWLKFTFDFQRGRCQSDTHTSPHVIRLLEVPIYLPPREISKRFELLEVRVIAGKIVWKFPKWQKKICTT